MPVIACKLLRDLGKGSMFNTKNDIDNNANATPISDNFDQEVVKNFTAE